MILEALAVVALVTGAFAIALTLRPTAVAEAVRKIPGIGGYLTAECTRCDAPVLTSRAEKMPTVFPSDPMLDAVTFKFCDQCSLTMTLEDRMEMLQEHRGDET